MNKEKTLSILKPDAVERGITGKINSIFEENGLKIVAQKMILLSERTAKRFYIEHKDRPFFGNLIRVMTSGPVVVQVLEGENAITKNRQLMGTTNPAEAAEGTIRKMFGINVTENSTHGSDSVDNAKREIGFFFSDMEQFDLDEFITKR